MSTYVLGLSLSVLKWHQPIDFQNTGKPLSTIDSQKTYFKDKNMTRDTEKLTKKLMVQKSCKTIGSLSHPIIFTRFYTSIQTVVGLGSSEPSTSSIDFILRDETTRLWAEGGAAAAHTSPGVTPAVWKVRNMPFEIGNSYGILSILHLKYISLRMLDDIMYCPDKNCQWIQQSSNFNQSSQLAGESPSRSAKVATNHLPKLYMSHARGCCRNLWRP